MSYNNYLKSNHWLETKKFIGLTDIKECYLCGSIKSLNIHHLRYETINFEDGNELIYLCRKHHKQIHFKKNGEKRQIITESDLFNQLKWLNRTMRQIRGRNRMGIIQDIYNKPLKLFIHLKGFNEKVLSRKQKAIQIAKNNMREYRLENRNW